MRNLCSSCRSRHGPVRADFPERHGRFANERTARTPAFGLHYEARAVQIHSGGGMSPMARVSGSGDGWISGRIGRRSRPLAALGGLPSAGAGLLAHWHDDRESRLHSVRHRNLVVVERYLIREVVPPKVELPSDIIVGRQTLLRVGLLEQI